VTSGTLVLGLLNGLTIALLAVGFVLVYKANRFLNLAHAQLGAVSAMLLAKAVGDWGWNWWLAFVLMTTLGVATGIVVERFLIRPVRSRTRSGVRLLMLTIGISQLLLGVTYMPWLSPDRNQGQVFPQPFTSHANVGDVVLTGMSILTLVVVPVLLALLAWFLSFSSAGKQIRAAAGNADAARLCGISIDRVNVITWGLAGGLSAVSAILSGPTTATFNAAAIGPSLLMLTMGAAAFGAFVSIPVAAVGGIGLGLVYQIVAAETSNAGKAQLAVFIVILAAILVRGRAIGRVFASEGAAVPDLPSVRVPNVLRSDPMVRFSKWWLAAAALLLAAALPRLPYFRTEAHRFLLVLVLLYALLGVALTALVGWGGQVSLGHFAIVGLGAYLTARWAGHGWTIPGLVLVIGLIGAAVTAAVGLPALRVRGLTLAVTTLGFAVIAPQWLFLQGWIGGDTLFTAPVERPPISQWSDPLTSQLSIYYVALVLLVLAVLALSSLRRSNAGRVIIAVRDNERSSTTFGLTPATVKLAVLALSGFIAATAGVIWALAWQRVSPSQFSPDVSIAVLAVPIVGGLGSIAGAIAAAALLYLPTFFLAPHVSGLFGSVGRNVGFLLVLGGLGVVLTMHRFPNGVAGVVQAAWQRHLDRRAASIDEQRSRPDAAYPLAVRDVSVSFGGVAALDRAQLVVEPGEIVGLIGPNGAGKTTLMNVISGVVTPVGGSVQVFGHEVVDLPPEARAGYGLARSFQDASLFAGLTVIETIQVAIARDRKTGFLPALLAAPWVRAFDRETREKAEEVVSSFGLEPWADAMASELSTGTRRICELAAQVAGRPRLLLLDEPTAGVAQRDAEEFGPLIRRIRDDLDCAILVIEHDMPLLMGLCDRVYAMEAGRIIAEGTPQQIRDDPAVIASYLGTDAAAIGRSNDRPGTRPRRGAAISARRT
jgi:ABC-type branched-subunit amino acid transport system ATPase component/ABC-type branched-subunit amino acid transport system permease subunit